MFNVLTDVAKLWRQSQAAPALLLHCAAALKRGHTRYAGVTQAHRQPDH